MNGQWHLVDLYTVSVFGIGEDQQILFLLLKYMVCGAAGLLFGMNSLLVLEGFTVEIETHRNVQSLLLSEGLNQCLNTYVSFRRLARWETAEETKDAKFKTFSKERNNCCF